MGITPNFNQNSIKAELERRAEVIRKMIIRRLTELGERCLIEARTGRTYQDQTGNLLASTGYVLVDHGSIIKLAGFEKPKRSAATKQGDADNGAESGKYLAEALAGKATKKGYALIMVAGMHYADYVEATGKNVLASAERFAEREFPEMLRRLKQNVSKMK